LFRKDNTGAEFTAWGSMVCGSVFEAHRNVSAEALNAARLKAPPKKASLSFFMFSSVGVK
jgi:hypothetical protein